MANVGFCGGSTLLELGPTSDMQAFFGCVELAVARLPQGDGGLLTDRLYRRYLKLEQLDAASEMLEQITGILSRTRTKDIDWASIHRNPASTQLLLSAATVDQVVDRYLKGAQDLIDDARSFEKRFGVYQPVMTIISDLPRFLIDEQRPLAEYDALEGEPIWLRP
jgi:hypothetical protein